MLTAHIAEEYYRTRVCVWLWILVSGDIQHDIEKWYMRNGNIAAIVCRQIRICTMKLTEPIAIISLFFSRFVQLSIL